MMEHSFKRHFFTNLSSVTLNDISDLKQFPNTNTFKQIIKDYFGTDEEKRIK